MLFRLLLALAVVASCSRSQPSPAPAPQHATQAKDPAKARAMISAGALVLDVRTPDEYGEAHLAGATNVPVDEIETRLGVVATLAHDDIARLIVVYCAAGTRSARAKQVLDAAGYT